ncbi:MAG: sigma-70 family RNA polymerase sigma factor [Phycisphaerae bacterium]|nr:sigma-70 family RNA polymerase sigma factor [Phycisphaerae bacterium]
MDVGDEKDLVRKLVERDCGAWEAFCGTYAPLLLGLVRRSFGCRPEQAEDIVQMTFIRCVRSIHSYDADRGRLFPWLRSVARNEARTYMGKDGACAGGLGAGTVPIEMADQVLRSIDTAALPEEALARQDVQDAVRETLGEISLRHCDVLLAKYVRGHTVAVIAERLGLGEKATESLLSRARSSFRERFARKLAPEESRRLRCHDG